MTLIIVLQGLFATSFPFAKYLLGFASPMFVSGIRMAISGALLLGYQYFVPSNKIRIKKEHIFMLVQIIVLGMYMTYGLRLYAARELPVWKTSFFYNLSPFISALYAYLIFGEKLSSRQWFGLVVGLLGMVPMLISSGSALSACAAWTDFFCVSYYELFLIASVSLHCYSWILIQKLVRNHEYTPAMVNGIAMFCGGALSLLTSYFLEGIVTIANPQGFFTALGSTVLIGNIICHNLYATLLKKYSATFMSFTSFLSPLFAALYGWAFFQESITWHFYVSSIVVLCGLYIFYRDELRKKRIIE